MFRGFSFGGDPPQAAWDPGTLERARERMVRTQLEGRDIDDPRVLRAMRAVPRHAFVPPEELALAYEDHALPIAYGQTISQPYIVAFMAQVLEPQEGLRALEVGAGTGYQAAVLAACGLEVFAIERIPELVETARRNLAAAGLADRVELRLGDGREGWPERAAFDRILVSAATDRVPDALVEQLRPGGFLVAPVGGAGHQRIRRYVKRGDGGLEEESLIGARFVPLVEGVSDEMKEPGG
ncbi:MAG: protein-L-isoaspartate(D-aspartate) O-methyltransferase [Gemmatimonadota bacterium]